MDVGDGARKFELRLAAQRWRESGGV